MWGEILPFLGQAIMSLLGGGDKKESSGTGDIASAASSLLGGGQKQQGNDLVTMGQSTPTPAPQITPYQPKSISEILSGLMNKSRGF